MPSPRQRIDELLNLADQHPIAVADTTSAELPEYSSLVDMAHVMSDGRKPRSPHVLDTGEPDDSEKKDLADHVDACWRRWVIIQLKLEQVNDKFEVVARQNEEQKNISKANSDMIQRLIYVGYGIIALLIANGALSFSDVFKVIK